MKWFKHIAKSRNDALIRDAITLFGLAGEHVFWRTMEIMSDEFNIKTPGYNQFLIKSWIKNYETSFKKTIKILSFFHNYPNKKKRIFFKIRGSGSTQIIQLNCPKLKTMCDNWTQKQLKKTTESERSKNEATFRSRARLEGEGEGEGEKDPKGSKNPSFLEINSEHQKRLNELRQQLQPIFPDITHFINEMLCFGKNPKSIIHAFERAIKKKDFDDTRGGIKAYCYKIVMVEDGNYNYNEFREKHDKIKQITQNIGEKIT